MDEGKRQMEIRESEKSIKLEFVTENVLYVEWCDGQVLGGREVECAAACAQELRAMLLRVDECVGAREIFAPAGLPVRVVAEHLQGYFRVKLGYVPEEDLLPWQWVEAEDYFREKDYAAIAKRF